MNSRLLVALFLSALPATGWCSSPPGITASEAMLRAGVKLPEGRLSNFHALRLQTSMSGGLEAGNANGKDEGQYFELEWTKGVEPAKGEQLVKERTALLKSMYDGSSDPYFTAITRKSECQEKFRFKALEKSEGLLTYLLYSNQEHSPGACTESTAKNLTYMAIGYCKKAKVFFVAKHHLPRGKRNEAAKPTFSGARCAP